jgi:hypothetical protein
MKEALLPRAPSLRGVRAQRSFFASAAPAAETTQEKISDVALDVSAFKPKSQFLK